MKNYLLFLSLLFASIQIFAQDYTPGSDAEKRETGTFNAIEASLGITVYITAGEEEAVYVTADNKEHIKNIKTEVNGNTLKITYTSEKLKIPKGVSGLKAYVTIAELRKIDFGTGAEIHIPEEITLENLEIKGNTGGRLTGNLNITNNLSVSLSTGTSVELTGSAAALNVDCSVGSNFYAYNLSASKCIARAYTGAKLEVNVEDLLSATATTGGQITYKGNASLQEVNVKNGGSVKNDN